MYNAAALLDVHERAHRSLQKLLRHCGELNPGEFERELPGFGYPSVRLQLEHVIGAEEYWISVVRARYDGGEDSRQCPTVEALETYRRDVADVTAEYLHHASEAELNTPREMRTWPDNRRLLAPAHVILRTQTHIYQHQGQVLAMCRLLGKPGPAGLDFPLD
jgi:uncharacterized damage-inducible protein DinB